MTTALSLNADGTVPVGTTIVGGGVVGMTTGKEATNVKRVNENENNYNLYVIIIIEKLLDS